MYTNFFFITIQSTPGVRGEKSTNGKVIHLETISAIKQRVIN